jgi:uncharacterized protein YfiM (DUF2279 family)
MIQARGVDYAWGRPRPTWLHDNGYRFAGRYVSYDSTGKNLTLPEARALAVAGISVVTNWEWQSVDALGGFTAGVKHAQDADAMARARGMPADRPIYFSVDFQVTLAQWTVVRDYWRGLASVIGAPRVGVYGGYDTIEQAMASGSVHWYWQTFAWSSGRWHEQAHIRQVRNGVTLDGADCDLDEAWTVDYGQWQPGQQDGGDPFMGLTQQQQNDLYFTEVSAPNGPSHVRDGLLKAIADGLTTKVDDLSSTVDAIQVVVQTLLDRPPAIVAAQDVVNALKSDPEFAALLAQKAFEGEQRAEQE